MITCSICLDPVDEEKNYLVTDCKHKFHFSCIIKNIDYNFYRKGLNCPICRASLLPNRVTSTTIISRVTGGGPVPRIPPPTLTAPTLTTPRLIPPRPPVPVVIRPMQNRNTIQSNITNITNILNQIDNMQNRLQNVRERNRVQNRQQNRRIQPGIIVQSQRRGGCCRKSIALKKIDKLTYSQLKNELKKRNLSTRGYKRDTLEKRLLKNMLGN